MLHGPVLAFYPSCLALVGLGSCAASQERLILCIDVFLWRLNKLYACISAPVFVMYDLKLSELISNKGCPNTFGLVIYLFRELQAECKC